jgi:hypothetical protein
MLLRPAMAERPPLLPRTHMRVLTSLLLPCFETLCSESDYDDTGCTCQRWDG